MTIETAGIYSKQSLKNSRAWLLALCESPSSYEFSELIALLHELANFNGGRMVVLLTDGDKLCA